MPLMSQSSLSGWVWGVPDRGAWMSQTGMMQRCWEHDYYAPSFYMITIVVSRIICQGGVAFYNFNVAPVDGLIAMLGRAGVRVVFTTKKRGRVA